jgi:antirestriction protein ArdC
VRLRYRGFQDPRWCTYNQAKAAGWHIRRGEKAEAHVEFWSWYVRVAQKGKLSLVTAVRAKELIDAGRLSPEAIVGDKFLRGKSVSVFNASQIEGIPALPAHQVPPKDERVEAIADELIASSRCPIHEVKSDDAFYASAFDEITVPLRTQFDSMEGFCRTLTHEMCHSTASALGRLLPKDEASYAYEELVAELGCVFATADVDLEIGSSPAGAKMQTWTRHHAAYLKAWVNRLRDDPGILSKAASEASKASDFVIAHYEKIHTKALDEREVGRPLSEKASGTRQAAKALNPHAAISRSTREF